MLMGMIKMIVIWYYKINKPKGASVLSVASIQDVDGDDVADCLAGGLHEMVYCISGASQGEADVIWTYPTDANILSVASIADVDEDGYSDCLAGGYDNKVYCISGNTGNKIWQYNTLATVYDVDSISDVNNDGIDDCIAGSADDSVHCIDGRTGEGLWIEDIPNGTVVCVTSISDVNSNGVSDVVAGSGDNYVYVFEGGENIAETVSTPGEPSGPSEVKVGTDAEFNTGGSVSNLVHPVEYCFDWGDGSMSSWGDSSQNHTFITVGSFTIKSRARCTIHTDILSDWSAAKTVATTGHTLLISIEGSGTVTQDPVKSSYNHNETVSLTATPSSEYQFDQWGGDVTGSNPTMDLIMDADKTVTAYFTQIPETITTPNQPEGPVTGHLNEELTFTATGAESNLGHELEYRFDWGNGNYSDWNGQIQVYSWQSEGIYEIKSQARCSEHQDVVSGWSEALSIDIYTTGVERVEMTQVPDHFNLFQNYPNPFNGETCITFQLPQSSLVHLEIFNLSGDLIKKYPEGYYPAGMYRVYWNCTNQTEQSLPSGLYFYRLQAGNYYSVKSMIYLK